MDVGFEAENDLCSIRNGSEAMLLTEYLQIVLHVDMQANAWQPEI